MVQSILEFDARKITPEARQRVRQLLQQKANSFRPEIIRRASVAAEPLAARRPPPGGCRDGGGLAGCISFCSPKPSDIF